MQTNDQNDQLKQKANTANKVRIPLLLCRLELLHVHSLLILEDSMKYM